jgi:hypothetical protein
MILEENLRRAKRRLREMKEREFEIREGCVSSPEGATY